MRTCEDYIDLISARLDGLLTHEEEQELEAHLADCADCRALADQMAEIHASFPNLEEIPAPDGFAKGVMERIGSRTTPKKVAVPFFSRPQVRALAGLAACAVLCVGIYQSGLWNRWRTGGAVNDMATASTGIESETRSTGVEADDGTGVGTGSSSVPEQKMLTSCPPPSDTGAAADSGGQTGASRSANAAIGGAGAAADSDGQMGAGQSADSAAGGGGGAEIDSGADSADGSSSIPEEKFFTASLLPPEAGESANAATYEVAGQTVDAILTLPQLPEGGQDVLGTDVEWIADEQGRACCIVTGEQMEALMALAEAQGQDLTGAATNSIDADGLCALVLEQ
ncbi:MAG: zf-HC2 domain-containing protein [Pseudoflavonifractor sp.]|nr:zf-HC2 domain-containing protein [Pseudoflavonifractor sp.]